MAEIQVDGVRIHYEVHGSGPPVVVLHGMGSSFELMGNTAGWLETLQGAGFQVIGVDARGAGRSQPVEQPDLLAGRPYLRDIPAVLDAVGVERAHFFGYSMGAGYTLALALARPERVRSIAIGGLGGTAMAFAGLYFQSGLFSRLNLTQTGPNLSRMFAQRNDYLPRYTAAQFEAFARDPLERGDLEALRLPALIVVGEHDTAQGEFAAVAVTASLAERIPGASRLVIPDTDHMNCPRDPSCKRAVVEFFSQQER